MKNKYGYIIIQKSVEQGKYNIEISDDYDAKILNVSLADITKLRNELNKVIEKAKEKEVEK